MNELQIIQLSEQYLELKQKKTYLEKKLDDLKQEIGKALGADLSMDDITQVIEHEEKLLIITNAHVMQNRLDTKALKAERWDIYEKYLMPTVSSRFTIKWG